MGQPVIKCSEMTSGQIALFVSRTLHTAAYLITALVIGTYWLYGLMNVVNGAPVNFFSLTLLLGSLTLVGAALALPFRPLIGARVGLAGSLLLWVYYAPLVVVGFGEPFTTREQIRSLISDQEYVPLLGTLAGPILLVVCTVSSILILTLRRSSVKGVRTV